MAAFKVAWEPMPDGDAEAAEKSIGAVTEAITALSQPYVANGIAK